MRRPGMGPGGIVACWLTIVVVVLSGCTPVGSGRMTALVGQPVVAMTHPHAAHPELAARAFGAVPLLFVENHGQTDPRVTHYIHGSGASIFFTPQTVTHILRAPAHEASTAEAPTGGQDDLTPELRSAGRTPERGPTRHWAVQVEMVGADPGVQPRATTPASTVVSYFKGREADWKAGLPTATNLVYPDAWPGIDVVYEGAAGRLKSSYLVRPGADPGRIVLAYRGASAVSLGEDGALEVSTPLGSFREEGLVAYQDRDGIRVEIAAAFRVEAAPDLDASLVTFELRPYDPALPLVIDPVILYKKPLGGPHLDGALSVKVDSAGNAYVSGITEGLPAGVPVGGPDLGHNGTWDVYVGKLNAAGDAFVYLGYIGSNRAEEGGAIAIDTANRAYVVGTTDALPASPGNPNGFPVKLGPSLTRHANRDAFVARVSASGTSLDYAGYIGGDGVEVVGGVAADAAGNAYVVGTTSSTRANGFPWAVGPAPDNLGGDDGFIAKVRTDGAALMYAGFVGTALGDGLLDVAVDASGSAYAVGDTRGHVPGRTDRDVMLVKVTPTGDTLEYWSGWGGTGDDLGKSIALDQDGRAYVAGQTNSTNYPSQPGFRLRGQVDGFVAKVNLGQNQLVYSRYLGGDGFDAAYGIALDSARNAYVTGFTQSTPSQGFPILVGPDLTYSGVVDGFLVKIRPTGDSQVFGTYFEGDTGSSGTQLVDVAVDQWGNAYVVGLGVDAFDPTAVRLGPHGVIGKIGEPASLPPTPPATFCAPRPPVRVTTSRTLAGHFQVTVTAGTSAGTTANTLREIRIGAAKNVLIDFPQGPIGVIGDYNHPLPSRPTATTFTIRRAGDGAFTVPLDVVDDCLPVWKTFVGGGAGV